MKKKAKRKKVKKTLKRSKRPRSAKMSVVEHHPTDERDPGKMQFTGEQR